MWRFNHFMKTGLDQGTWQSNDGDHNADSDDGDTNHDSDDNVLEDPNDCSNLSDWVSPSPIMAPYGRLDTHQLPYSSLARYLAPKEKPDHLISHLRPDGPVTAQLQSHTSQREPNTSSSYLQHSCSPDRERAARRVSRKLSFAKVKSQCLSTPNVNQWCNRVKNNIETVYRNSGIQIRLQV